MGREAICRVEFGEQCSEGKALLETDVLIFRGSFRLSIPFREITAVTARQGKLDVTFPAGLLSLELGGEAEKWAHQITNPKGLLDKLGVRSDSRVVLMGITDKSFERDLAARVSRYHRDKTAGSADFVFLTVESKSDLGTLSGLVSSIAPKGAIWVVYPKGRKDIRESDVMAASKKAGLVDTKVCAFSPSHTALKMVIPVAKRHAGRQVRPV